MNLLHFHTHDSGRYLRHFGYHDAPTHNLSGWAQREAVTFTNAFTPAPTCSPSRAALLTGAYPHSNGMLGLAHRGFRLTDYRSHLAAWLGDHGYRTALCGVQHEAAGCFESRRGAKIIGYHEDLTAPMASATPDGSDTAAWDWLNASRAARWLDTAPEEPFFLSVGLYAAHREFPPASDISLDRIRPLSGIPDSPETREDHARFLAALHVVDRSFAVVIAALEHSRLSDDTIVLFTTDHGVAQPHYKCNLTGGGLGVAVMLKVPGVMPPSREIDALVSTVDVLPTLCEFLELDAPPGVQGESFAHLLRENDGRHREYAFSEMNFHTSYEPMRGIRSERYSLVRNHDREYPFPHLSNVDDSPAKSALVRGGWGSVPTEPVELYDLLTDPLEKRNVAAVPEYAAVRNELENALDEWQRVTGDPLINGAVGRPAGSVVNRPECVEPDSPDPADYL